MWPQNNPHSEERSCISDASRVFLKLFVINRILIVPFILYDDTRRVHAICNSTTNQSTYICGDGVLAQTTVLLNECVMKWSWSAPHVFLHLIFHRVINKCVYVVAIVAFIFECEDERFYRCFLFVKHANLHACSVCF